MGGRKWRFSSANSRRGGTGGDNRIPSSIVAHKCPRGGTVGRVSPTLWFRDWCGPGPSVKTQPLNDVNLFDGVQELKFYFKANGINVGGFSTSLTRMIPPVQQGKRKIVIRLP